MPSESGATTSIWMRAAVPDFPALDADCRVDVCIVGGGITGLTTAYLLAEANRSVAVLEDGAIGSGETGRTTAHLSNALDDRYCELERLHGTRGARCAADSHTAAIDEIEAIVRKEAIACEFTRLDGYLFLAPGDPAEKLERELGAALRVGLRDVHLMPRAPLATFDTGPCLHFPRQAQFHPLEYLAGLARALVRSGGRIFAGTHVADIEGGTPCRVRTDGGAVVTADAVVVATNTPINDRLAIHAKQAAYRTYVVTVPVPRGSVPPGLYWDTADPYHYVRLRSGDERCDHLIVGGEDHRTGQAHDTEKRFERLLAWARERFPVAGPPVERWSGQIMEPMDGLAFIGPDPARAKNVYVATGDSGHGLTHGTIAGMLLRDLITGTANPWAALYDPGRKSAHAIAGYARANFNVARQYARHLTGGEVSSPEDIPPGSGAVLRHGLHKLAVYRDSIGIAHAYSAVCPHAGCIVRWNRTEETWDCPCHGSRFDLHGHVVNGPANRALEPVHVEGMTTPPPREEPRGAYGERPRRPSS